MIQNNPLFRSSVRNAMAESRITTMKDLADRAGIAYPVLRRLMAGDTQHVQTKTLQSLTLALRTPLEQLQLAQEQDGPYDPQMLAWMDEEANEGDISNVMAKAFDNGATWGELLDSWLKGQNQDIRNTMRKTAEERGLTPRPPMSATDTLHAARIMNTIKNLSQNTQKGK